MKAYVIDRVSDLTKEYKPLKLVNLPRPELRDGELLIKVRVCGICHTELDEIEGRTPPPAYPVVPGHQVVGVVEESSAENSEIKVGDRVGVAWIFKACGECEYCASGRENLCPDFIATGRDVNGGYAEYMAVPAKYAYPIPDIFSDAEAAPLLCAGAIGYRSVALCNTQLGHRIGLTGFGASAHLVLKLIRYQHPDSDVYVFARNLAEREFARELGAVWSGDISEKPSQLLGNIIDTTPVWKPVIKALECLKPGGRLVINAIRKESIDTHLWEQLDYEKHLWMEKEIKSVANVTRRDVTEFIRIAAEMPFKPDVKLYSFKQANEALIDIKQQKIKGAKVLVVQDV